ncbi:MAG: hypothetical protein PQJ59_06170 [Spirochaetales bacterium]|nr:hypothetical protein [Spirochaetales bacterium]
MKKVVFTLTLLVLSMSLFAQETSSLEDLRLFTRSALLKAEQESRKEGTDSLVMGNFHYDGYETPLGVLIFDLMAAEITKSSQVQIVGNPTALREEGKTWLVVEGTIHKIEAQIYMQIRVLSEGVPMAIVEKTMDYSPLAELLVTNEYDDYYYEEVLVEEDFFMEPNDDPYSAVEYIPGEAYELALLQGDVDWFYFTVTSEDFRDDVVMVEIFTTGDTDTYMTVYGPDDPDLYYGEADDYLDGNAGMIVPAGEPGTYWVAVSGYSETTNGYYQLDSRRESMAYADEFEPNNTRDSATILGQDDSQEHVFGRGDNLDIFVYTQESFGEVVFFTESQMDTYMDLYDEYGNYIASDDDGGKDSNARLQIDLNRGTYYLELRPYDEAANGSYLIVSETE